ncbi:hypothetical protein HMPREF0972_01190 [Actinomyces sp. oral taxon 848 str. F0332]|nr:hypothetical protein HMPREF0972_01190 [Actinomyces sp. oral taxon 848 str. F0332]
MWRGSLHSPATPCAFRREAARVAISISAQRAPPAFGSDALRAHPRVAARTCAGCVRRAERHTPPRKDAGVARKFVGGRGVPRSHRAAV